MPLSSFGSRTPGRFDVGLYLYMMDIVKFFKFIGEKNPNYSWDKTKFHFKKEWPVEGKGGIIDGERQGEFVKGAVFRADDFENGSVYNPFVKERLNYKDGMLDGVQYEYYPNGTIQKKINMVDGHNTGLSSHYYEDGSLKKTIEYKNNGYESIEYFEGPGEKIKVKGSYVHNYPHGEKYYYFEDGGVASIETYHHGQMIAIKNFYPNGNIKSEKIKGESGNVNVGEIKNYHENGNLWEYINGKTKQHYWYRLDGSIITKIDRVEGNHYRMVLYYDNGQIELIKNFKQEPNYPAEKVNDGEIIRFDREGNVIDKRMYKDGFEI